MPPEPLSSTPGDELQFSTAEPANAEGDAAAAQVCLGCKRPIDSVYFALGQQVLCPTCCAQLQAPPKGSRAGRLFKASLMGLGAGLVGALIWFAIRRLAHVEIGLVAILVGFMVGKAVRKGSGGLGGRGYQILAVVLTYCCIAANYMPDIIEGALDDIRQHRAENGSDSGTTAPDKTDAAASDSTQGTNSSSTPAAKPPIKPARAIAAVFILLALVFALSLAAPFLAGAQNLIGLLIIGFALWEAWKFNKRVPLPITGPYEIGSAAPGVFGVNV